MYDEISTIQAVKNKQARIKLYLAFIEEYAGWVQHLKEVGIGWGASGEEVGAAKEAIVAKKHIETLKQKVMAELNESRHNKKNAVDQNRVSMSGQLPLLRFEVMSS